MQTNFEIKSQVQIILIMDYPQFGLSLAQLSPSLLLFIAKLSLTPTPALAEAEVSFSFH